jgi:tetratricopeptide (TPR) repeat protein
MPSKPAPKSRVQAPPSDAAPDKDYKKLISFLRLASGFSLAVARCNFPSFRGEIIRRATKDAADMGLSLKVVDVSTNPSPDFVAMVRGGLDGAPAVGRLAIMVTGIDVLIYQSASEENLRGEGRTPFIARLNFDRERIARDLPYPLILWLESESLNVLLKKAPDLSQWISAHFQFGGTAAEDTALARLVESDNRLDGQPVAETRKQVDEFKGLLQELNETLGREDPVALRKRLAVLNALAERYYRTADYLQARKYWTEALEIAKRLGDRRAEGRALGNLGVAYRSLGEYRRAIEYHEKHLAIARGVGDRRGEGAALGNLGIAYASLGEYRRAIEFHEQALAIYREIGDRRGEGATLGNLGIAYASLGEYRRAIEYYDEQLAITRQIGDRWGEGHALGNLGVAYKNLGEYPRAIEYHLQHLALAREIGDLRGEGHALGNLGLAYLNLGEYRRAIGYHEQYLSVARAIGDREGEGNALWNMSSALDQLGKRVEAIERAQEALGLFQKIESPFAEAVRRQLEQWQQKQ